MSIYGSITYDSGTTYGCVSTANMKATIAGHIYDVVDTANAVENGSNLKLGAQVSGQWNVLAAATPAVGDKIVLVASPILIYDTTTTAAQFDNKFVNKAGEIAKCYEIVEDDVFGLSTDLIDALNDTTGVVVGNLVVVDGARKWDELASDATTATYGFIGKIIGKEVHDNITYVLVRCLKNATVA